jgi:fluoride exporter
VAAGFERALLVGLGGFLGSVLRWGVGSLALRALGASFPYGTLLVNVAGCAAIGAVSYLAEDRRVLSASSQAFLAVGVVGGFTTFSAFGNETLALARDGRTALAAANVAANVVLGLAAVWCGRAAAAWAG